MRMKANTLIPKEMMTAYERWEMASFDQVAPAKSAQIMEAPTEAAQNSSYEFVGPPRPLPPSPAEIDRLKKEAQDLGYHQGHEEGYATGLNKGMEEGRQQGWQAGYKEGLDAGTQEGLNTGTEQGRQAGHKEGYETGLAEAQVEMKALAAGLGNIMSSLGEAASQAGDTMAPALLGLSLDIAKAMLKSALQIKPELVIPVITEAIQALPESQGPIEVFLHPEDLTLVTTHLQNTAQQTSWKLLPDATLERGGCRVSTPANQLDATNIARWKRITDNLGKQSGWLE